MWVGTQLYRRFAADGDGLASCLEADVSSSVIHATVKDAKLWTQTVSAFSLPQSLDIIMGDVCGGSSSASMAREVLKWRKEHPVDAKKTWKSLADTNTKIYEALNALSAMFQVNAMSRLVIMLSNFPLSSLPANSYHAFAHSSYRPTLVIITRPLHWPQNRQLISGRSRPRLKTLTATYYHSW